MMHRGKHQSTIDLVKAQTGRRPRLHATGPELMDRSAKRELGRDFALDHSGPHGFAHWGRVKRNGLELAVRTGANPRVVELFAYFHDSKRENDGHDPDHGKRGARNALRYMESGALNITDDEFAMLFKACWGHTYEDVERPCITILTCWDADRLDLGRVGIVPHPDRLCTAVAREREVIQRAYERSMHWVRRYG